MYVAHILAQIAVTVSLQTAQPPAMQPGLTFPEASSSDTVRHRPRAIQISEAYATRLKIHRYGSYVMLPLFATQYVLGSTLLDQREDIVEGERNAALSNNLRRAHLFTALGVGTLFISNTTTGVWNLYEDRHNPDHRGLRTMHAITMLLSDAGFLVTGRMGIKGKNGTVADTKRHHNMAVASMGLATIGASMMWVFDH
jgi:hypothetical protein